MNMIRLALLSLVVALGGWLLVVPWLDAVAIGTKLGYMSYCLVIAVAVWLFLLLGLHIRYRMRGSSYALLSIAWALLGWVLTYFLAVALTSSLAALVSSSVYLAFIPVGLPVAEICAASATLGSLALVTLLFVDAARLLRSRERGG